jgi:pseudouridine-5'-phosphate glycosidase
MKKLASQEDQHGVEPVSPCQRANGAMAASVAVIGGALAGAMGQEQTETVATGSMSVGQTSSTTTAPTTIPVPVASPVLKASLPKGYR